ncbi:hypothetical protein MEO93_29480 [Dolichospermum sp. ST_sed3]|nr:hypothetical protein [Dolichospermum sp. ST_sed3]
MENFYIVLICKNGDVIHNTFATSHDDLIDKYTINKISNTDFFRAKFKPKDSHSLTNVDDYKLIIKETYIPEWFTNEFKEIIISKLKDIITSMIVSTHFYCQFN